MSDDQHEQYLAVLKALFDYEATSDDDVSIKEDQILLLLERTDDEWWKVQHRANTGDDENAPLGLVPANYVEEAEPKSTVKVLFDYEATSKGELSVIEDEILKVFDYEEQWILVKTDRDGGRVGYVPESYVQELNGENNITETNVSHIIVPDSPPPPPSASYMDPADRVAATADKAKADAIETWSVSEVESKGKKKKGTLGIGNGAIFFASESDKTPVQKWQISDVEDVKIEKSKHVHFQIAGLQPTNLHFHAGSKDVADAIVRKLKTSKGLANGLSSPRSEQSSPRPISPAPKKNGISVRFDPSPAVIPPRSETPVEGSDSPEGESAVALYDFVADGEDELTVKEGERLVVVDCVSSDEWWKCRNVNGAEGVVPALYIEIAADDVGSIAAEERSEQTAADEALAAKAERERQEREQEERERQEHERQEHERQEQQRERELQEREQQEREQRERKQRERKQREREQRERKREQQEREQQEREQQEREHQEREQQEREERELEEMERKAQEVRKVPKEARVSRSAPVDKSTPSAAGSKTEVTGRNSGETQPKFPKEGKTRIWHDHSGQWKTEAEFLGISKGKIRLHKINGVIIEVPPEKVSVADVRYIESITNKKLLPGTSLGSRSHAKDDDDTPLGTRKSELESGPRPALPPKKPTIDWFEFFLNAGCEVDDCTRYASAFERDKIDELILPDIKESTLRSLGLREGDIIRVTKAIEQRKGKSTQMTEDEQLARALQAEEDARRSTTTSPPNLFTGPGGTLRNQRRTRPQRTPTAPPVNVDANALIATSEQISRSASPLVSSPSAARASSPVVTQLKGIPQPSRFEDDAWTNRPSSTKPASVPVVTTSPPALAAPPAPVQRPVSTSVSPPVAVSSPAPAVTSVPAGPVLPLPPLPSVSTPPTTLTTTQPPTVLSPEAQPQQNNGQFELLARISQMRPPSAPVQHISTPLQPSAPQSFHSGLGMGSSQLPLGQHLQNQQTGLYQMPPPSGPRGPLAPVPSNQGLLSPLVPTIGVNQFIPTRPSSNPPLQLPSIQHSAQPVYHSFLSSSPVPGNPGHVLPQQTGFPGAFQGIGPQPTGFGNAYSGFANPTFMPPNNFGGIQPQPTGFNPAFPQQTFGQTNLTSLRPSSPQKDHSPASVFAQMKAGTFADDSDSQPADKYDALRQQPTGWQGPFHPQGYYGGF